MTLNYDRKTPIYEKIIASLRSPTREAEVQQWVIKFLLSFFYLFIYISLLQIWKIGSTRFAESIGRRNISIGFDKKIS